jgi:hypothetical protein
LQSAALQHTLAPTDNANIGPSPAVASHNSIFRGTGSAKTPIEFDFGLVKMPPEKAVRAQIRRSGRWTTKARNIALKGQADER